LSTYETGAVALEIDAGTEEPENLHNLKKALIRLLADPDIRKQIYEAIKTEETLREYRAKSYK
jgi:hypothetical protein